MESLKIKNKQLKLEISNVNVTINKIEEIIIIMNETIKELVKKKGKLLLFALFLFCTLFI